jgi:hypothetical protein
VLDFVRHTITSVRFDHGRSIAQANVRSIVRSAYLRWVQYPRTFVRVRTLVRSLQPAIVDERNRSNVRSLYDTTTTPPYGGRMGDCEWRGQNALDLYSAASF